MSVAQIGSIHVVPYNPEWPRWFESEREIMESALEDEALLIEHVGSTSVPGLIAKPRLDVVAVAKNRKRAIPTMEAIGYTYQGEWNMPLKAAFTKRGEIEVNLHMFFELSHPEVELNLRFRDYLREHEETREAYAQLKRDLLKDPTSQQIPHEFPLYTLRKGPFIESVLRHIGYSRLRVLKANTDEQLAKVAEFRTKAKASAEIVREDQEHVLLYRGVDIIGYASLCLQSSSNATVEMFEVEDPVDPAEATAFFKGLLREWQLVSLKSAKELNNS